MMSDNNGKDSTDLNHKKGEMITDAQTGVSFELKNELWYDMVAAWVSILYSLAVIACLSWLLLNTRLATAPAWFTPYKDALNSPVFKLVVYTAIGGGIGAAVNNVRSFVQWHAERKAFGWRFIWKYISMPPVGATLAVMVYAIIRGGIAVFNGGFSGNDVNNTTTLFSAWATGALAGYGSNKVFIWLDDKVNNMFKIADNVTVPDLSGQTQIEATKTLQDGKLAIGNVSEKSTSDDKLIGKVVDQDPKPKAEATPGSKVHITIGKVSDNGTISQVDKVKTPDVTGKTQDEAAKILEDSKLTLGDVSEQSATDEKMIGKVLDQDPKAETETSSGSKVAIIIGKAG